MKKILPLFSYLFHPVFISVYAGMLYLYFNGNYFSSKEQFFVLLQITIMTVCLPVLFYLLLRSLKKIDSVMAFEVSQRKVPLLLQSFLLIVLLRQNITIERYFELHFFFLGALMSTLLALVLVFFKVKASLHQLAISSLTVFAFGLSVYHQIGGIYVLIFLVLINGFVASSRLEMEAHTPKELGIGLLLGMIPQLLLLRLWL
ncbi:hypothetical protein [Flavobacterium restrictum]|uniref:Uncharacterized protein n=1 Tax=Flavobacterium restrictum TaxID=2594428 RepID=A0A553DVM5_9FLAO|nr:hypothetical protein [Flavobacterium restrictum]TRX36720.1 hypothetical protein FNW21_13095 [Flavobacterium restrictum]